MWAPILPATLPAATVSTTTVAAASLAATALAAAAEFPAFASSACAPAALAATNLAAAFSTAHAATALAAAAAAESAAIEPAAAAAASGTTTDANADVAAATRPLGRLHPRFRRRQPIRRSRTKNAGRHTALESPTRGSSENWCLNVVSRGVEVQGSLCKPRLCLGRAQSLITVLPHSYATRRPA